MSEGGPAGEGGIKVAGRRQQHDPDRRMLVGDEMRTLVDKGIVAMETKLKDVVLPKEYLREFADSFLRQLLVSGSPTLRLFPFYLFPI